MPPSAPDARQVVSGAAMDHGLVQGAGHGMAQGGGAWIAVLFIPLIVWLRLRGARRRARAQDFWFEPEGDHFIYHPFGRFGAAYLVTSAQRDAIRAKTARFARIAGVVVVAAAVGPILLLSADPALYVQWRPYMLAIRLGMVLALIPAGLAFRAVAVRPLLAGAGLAPRRISSRDVRAKQAASRSWWALGLAFGILGGLAGLLFYLAAQTGNAANAVYGSVLAVLALLNLRMMLIKASAR